jgi:hypothetical protein
MQFYFVCIFLLVLLHAVVDAKNILGGKSIDHKKESIEFSIYCVIISLLFYFYAIDMSFIKWVIYCILTIGVIRAGWFDFLLNGFRGLNIFYISKNADGNYTGTKESRWDDFIGKYANVFRIFNLVLSIIWFIFLNK